MIKKLRNKFISIATISVACVLLLLTIILNIANYCSVDANLKSTLDMIAENEGTIPENIGIKSEDIQKADGEKHGDGPKEPPQNGSFNAETPYSTRYFVIRYTDDGQIVSANLDKIASVTNDNLAEFVNVVRTKPAGYSSYDEYRILVRKTGDNKNMAIFLDSFQEKQSLNNVLIWSIVADIACISLVFILIVLISRRAIDPVVKSAEKQKQFITDAGHELKTPITVISTNMSVLEMDVGKNAWIDKTKDQTKKLTELVNSLVSLARYDEENEPIKKCTFDISQAIEETIDSFESSARSFNITLEKSIIPELNFDGDERAIRELTSILIDNAIKYATPETTVHITLVHQRKEIVFRISNAYDGDDSIDTERMFDRFYRADESRASTGSFGIGLSIARAIVEAHNGKISAAVKGDMVEIEVRLR